MAYILLAEDDEILAELVRHRLVNSGHEVRIVEDGEELMVQIGMRPPDLILLAAMLPMGSEGATLIALKANPSFASIPVVMMTASRNRAEVLAALRSGASDYVTKPFSPEDLALRIDGLLARTRVMAEDYSTAHSLH